MKRKTVQTKYDVPVRRAFRWDSEQQSCSAEASMIVRIPAPWLTKEIIFVCTVFLSFTLWMTCERTLIHAKSMLRSTPQNLLLYGKLNSGLLCSNIFCSHNIHPGSGNIGKHNIPDFDRCSHNHVFQGVGTFKNFGFWNVTGCFDIDHR